RSPILRATDSPTPSFTSKVFASAAPSRNAIRPSVRTPSTSSRRSRTRRARGPNGRRHLMAALPATGVLPPGRLEQLRAPQIVDVEDALDSIVRVQDDQRRDLAGFQE